MKNFEKIMIIIDESLMIKKTTNNWETEESEASKEMKKTNSNWFKMIECVEDDFRMHKITNAQLRRVREDRRNGLFHTGTDLEIL